MADGKKRWQEAGTSPVDEGVTWFLRLRQLLNIAPVQQEGGSLSGTLQEGDEVSELKNTLTILQRSLNARKNLGGDTTYISSQIDDIQSKIDEINSKNRWF